MIAALALVGNAASAWAAAGVVGDSTCCCPIKATCKCHDHDGKRDPSPTIKRCAGEATLVAPAQAPAIANSPPLQLAQPRVVPVSTAAPSSPIDVLPSPPETPPF